MAGLALLPWEKWLARILHPVYVAIRRSLYNRQRRSKLDDSLGWSEASGTVHSKKWDSSLPREELLYSYSIGSGYYSGSHWMWFDRSEAREVNIGDRIILGYKPDDPEESVFLRVGSPDTKDKG
jgi:hypothetical protein